MDVTLNEVVERLTEEFDQLPGTTVSRVVNDCANRWPDVEPSFIEQAARSQLQTVPRPT